jgi:hypothetical protein
VILSISSHVATLGRPWPLCSLGLLVRFDFEVFVAGPDCDDEVVQKALKPARPKGCGSQNQTGASQENSLFPSVTVSLICLYCTLPGCAAWR